MWISLHKCAYVITILWAPFKGYECTICCCRWLFFVISYICFPVVVVDVLHTSSVTMGVLEEILVIAQEPQTTTLSMPKASLCLKLECLLVNGQARMKYNFTFTNLL
jgi:hypothetical protein